MQTIPSITYITQMHLLKFIVRTKLEYQKNLFQYTLYMLHFQLEYPAAMLQLPFSQVVGVIGFVLQRFIALYHTVLIK